VAGVVDDEQWLDRASAQVLAFVARRLEAESVGLVFASRGMSDELAGLPELVVEGLREADARILLDSVLTGPLDARVRDQIVSETHGNPLALLELPREVTPAELAGGFGLPGAMPLPGRIEESFRQRLDALAPETRRLLQLAAADPVGEPSLVWRATSSTAPCPATRPPPRPCSRAVSRGLAARRPRISPPASVDNFLKWSAVDLRQRRQWPVSRIAERQEVCPAPIPGRAEQPSEAVLVTDRGVARADAQVGCSNSHLERRLAEVVLDQPVPPGIIGDWRNDHDRGRGPRDVSGGFPHERQLLEVGLFGDEDEVPRLGVGRRRGAAPCFKDAVEVVVGDCPIGVRADVAARADGVPSLHVSFPSNGVTAEVTLEARAVSQGKSSPASTAASSSGAPLA
jgi:hypothetical protein